MTLKNYVDKDWIKKQKTSDREISDLLAIVERDLKDASNVNISFDWKFPPYAHHKVNAGH